jgi:hypothetical protein
MIRPLCSVFISCALLALGVGEAAAQQIVAGYAVAGGSTVIILTDPALSNLITKHDRLFISLGIQRDFFRRNNPLNPANPYQPVVIEAQRFQVEEAELDRAIQRLGQLIRDAEKEGKR